MKRIKVIIAAMTAAAMMIGSLGATLVYADDDIRPTSVNIRGAKKTVYAGSTFELEARTTPSDADDDDLYWTVTENRSILKLEKDRADDEIEIKALKAGVAVVRCQVKGTNIRDYITITVKKPTYSFDRYGKKTKTVEVDDDFELKVKRSGGLKKNDLKWSIKNTKIVKFDDDDITDDEVELEARRVGTTTVTCYNKKTKETITYTIRVVPDRDDDDDDDDFDDDDNDDDDDDDDNDD